MAIRYRKEYGTWQVYWRNPFTGKRQSLTCATKAEAEKENSLIVHRLKYDSESFRPTEDSPTPTEITFEQVYLAYLCEKRFDKETLRGHRSNMVFILGKIGTLQIREITTQTLSDVKDELFNTFSPATANDRLRMLRTVMYFAVEKGYRDEIKFPRIPGPQYQRFIPPNNEELSALYQAAAPHIQRVIILGAFFGVRIGKSELFQLTWEDVDLIRRVLRVHGSRKNAASPWREVPIREDLVSLFEQWQAEDLTSGNQYLVHYKNAPVKSIKNAWEKALRRAGIERRIRPYDLRHTFGTELIASGVDIGTVASLMGHSSPTMLLRHYQYVLDRQKKDAVESLPNLSCVPHLCAAKNP